MQGYVEDLGDLIQARRRAQVAAILAIALALPLSAKAQTMGPVATLAVSAGAAVGRTDGGVFPAPRLKTDHWSPKGWGLFATTGGRSLDLSRRGGWADDPNASLGETEAGLGWRGRRITAVMGYAQPDFGPVAEYPHSPRPQGVVGLNIAFRTR